MEKQPFPVSLHPLFLVSSSNKFWVTSHFGGGEKGEIHKCFKYSSLTALASLSKPVLLQPCPPCGIIFVRLVFCQLHFLNELTTGSNKCLGGHVEGRIKLSGLQPHQFRLALAVVKLPNTTNNENIYFQTMLVLCSLKMQCALVLEMSSD